MDTWSRRTKSCTPASRCNAMVSFGPFYFAHERRIKSSAIERGCLLPAARAKVRVKTQVRTKGISRWDNTHRKRSRVHLVFVLLFIFYFSVCLAFRVSLRILNIYSSIYFFRVVAAKRFLCFMSQIWPLLLMRRIIFALTTHTATKSESGSDEEPEINKEYFWTDRSLPIGMEQEGGKIGNNKNNENSIRNHSPPLWKPQVSRRLPI